MNKNKHTDLDDDDLDHEGINRRQLMRRVGATTLGVSAVGVPGLHASTQPANALVITGTTALLAGGGVGFGGDSGNGAIIGIIAVVVIALVVRMRE